MVSASTTARRATGDNAWTHEYSEPDAPLSPAASTEPLTETAAPHTRLAGQTHLATTRLWEAALGPADRVDQVPLTRSALATLSAEAMTRSLSPRGCHAAGPPWIDSLTLDPIEAAASAPWWRMLTRPCRARRRVAGGSRRRMALGWWARWCRSSATRRCTSAWAGPPPRSAVRRPANPRD